MPCYNEEKHLDKIIEKIIILKEKLKLVNKDLNLIIIDDASKDNSLNIILNYSQKYSWIKVLKHPVNMGKGAALKTGFNSCTGDYIGIQDADTEYNPINYLSLLEIMEDKNVDVVYGSRYLKKNKNLCFWHTLMNKFLTFLSNLFLGMYVSDVETCYKLFSQKAIKNISSKLKENRFGFEIEITAHVVKEKYKIIEHPVDYNPRSYSEGKKITYKDGISALRCILKYSSKKRLFILIMLFSILCYILLK